MQLGPFGRRLEMYRKSLSTMLIVVSETTTIAEITRFLKLITSANQVGTAYKRVFRAQLSEENYRLKTMGKKPRGVKKSSIIVNGKPWVPGHSSDSEKEENPLHVTIKLSIEN